MSPRIVIGLFAASALFAVATVLISDPHAPSDIDQGPLVVGLADKVNDIASFTVTSGADSVTVARNGERWIVAETGGYLADFEPVKQTLVALTRMTKVEPKTADPERYDRLEVGDPEAEDATARRVVLRDADGAELAAIIVGKRGEPLGGGRETVYVRLPAEDRVWLAEGDMSLSADPITWTDKEIANLRQERVREVRVETVPASSDRVVIRRETIGGPLLLQNVPSGQKPKGGAAVDTLAYGLEYLDLTEVRKADGSERMTHRATYESFDGMRIAVEVVEVEGAETALIRLNAETEPVTDIEAIKAEQGAVHEHAVLRDGPAAEAEAAALDARAEGWLFAVPTHKLDRFRTSIKDLLEDAGPES